MIDEIIRAKPAAAKGRYLLSITVTTTMGPGIRVDPTQTREAEILAGAPSGNGAGPRTSRPPSRRPRTSRSRKRAGAEPPEPDRLPRRSTLGPIGYHRASNRYLPQTVGGAAPEVRPGRPAQVRSGARF